jgi:hypothetical protein
MWRGVQPSNCWLTDRDSAIRRQLQRSLVLRLLPHFIRRGKHSLRSDSSLLLILRGQIEYIWSGKTSFGVSFSRVPAFWRTPLMDRKFLCCSSWYGRLCVVTAHPILHAMKNRYWPLWYLLWKFVGGYPSPLDLCSLQTSGLSNRIFLSRVHTAGAECTIQ